MTHAMPRTRALLVLLMTLGLMLGSLAAPAAATSGGDGGGDDLESVRGQTLNTIDYKIGLLTNLRDGTDNPDRKSVYDGGIAALREMRGDAETSGDIEALRAMDASAHDIYHATKAAAEAVGQTDEERVAEARRAALDTINYKLGIFRDAKAGTSDPALVEIYSWAIAGLEELKAAAESTDDIDALHALKAKAHQIYDATKKKVAGAGSDDPPKTEKTKEEKAAEALAKARRSTLRLIEYKISIFTHAAEAAKNPHVSALYEDAAEAIAELVDDAQQAGTVGALRGIDAQVMEIYEATKQAVADDHGGSKWQPTETMVAHLASLETVVERLIGVAEATAEQSPDTAKAVAKAGSHTVKAIEAVGEAAETGRRLDARWADLRVSVHDFRIALAAHVTAVTGGPGCVNGWQLPG